jgi:hypothetical protein
MTTKYTHKEAFALMWYACKCGHRERIWNSRDGVTPFGASCPSCSTGIINHVDWQNDVCAPDHKPNRWQKIWRDGTPDEAEAIMRRRIERYKGGPWEPSANAAADLILLAREAQGEFRKGWPALDHAAESQR